MADLKNIIVIGASAGGFQAIKGLVSVLPENEPVAVFIVMHMAKNSMPEVLIDQLTPNTSFNCSIAKDGAPIEANHIYLAPADLHLLVKKDTMRLIKGTHENRWRPSIDVLFRSAAAMFDSQVVGIILTGMLDDGTSGMSAIKRCGGICIVQEPTEALFPDMPISVLNNVDVDYRVPIADMRYVLEDVLSRPKPENVTIPEDVKLEADITERMMSSITDLEKLGEHSNYTCPDCGGGLWRMKYDPVIRYRCHTGHVYTEKLLIEKQSEALEESIWVSIRMMEERRNLLTNIAYRNAERNFPHIELENLKRAEEINNHIERLKNFLVSLSKTETPDEGYL